MISCCVFSMFTFLLNTRISVLKVLICVRKELRCRWFRDFCWVGAFRMFKSFGDGAESPGRGVWGPMAASGLTSRSHQLGAAIRGSPAGGKGSGPWLGFRPAPHTMGGAAGRFIAAKNLIQGHILIPCPGRAVTGPGGPLVESPGPVPPSRWETGPPFYFLWG